MKKILTFYLFSTTALSVGAFAGKNQFSGNENEMPISEGEVTLYRESVWNNTSFASFNFQYSTSGNDFIIIDNREHIVVESDLTGFVSKICRRKLPV